VVLGDLKWDEPVSHFLVDEFIDLLKARGIVMERVSWELENGIKGLRNLLRMLRESLRQEGIEIKRTSGGWDWVGYYLNHNGNRYFVGVWYDNPNIVRIQTEENWFDAKDANVGKIIDEGKKWLHELPLDSEEVHFFARKVGQQQERLCQFLKECKIQMDAFSVT